MKKEKHKNYENLHTVRYWISYLEILLKINILYAKKSLWEKNLHKSFESLLVKLAAKKAVKKACYLNINYK